MAAVVDPYFNTNGEMEVETADGGDQSSFISSSDVEGSEEEESTGTGSGSTSFDNEMISDDETENETMATFVTAKDSGTPFSDATNLSNAISPEDEQESKKGKGKVRKMVIDSDDDDERDTEVSESEEESMESEDEEEDPKATKSGDGPVTSTSVTITAKDSGTPVSDVTNLSNAVSPGDEQESKKGKGKVRNMVIDSDGDDDERVNESSESEEESMESEEEDPHATKSGDGPVTGTSVTVTAKDSGTPVSDVTNLSNAVSPSDSVGDEQEKKPDLEKLQVQKMELDSDGDDDERNNENSESDEESSEIADEEPQETKSGAGPGTSTSTNGSVHAGKSLDDDQIMQTLEELEIKQERNRSKRFDFLLKQTEIWGHFMQPAYQEALKFSEGTGTSTGSAGTDSIASQNSDSGRGSQKRKKAPKLRLPAMMGKTNSKEVKPDYVTHFDSTPDYIEWGEMRDYQVRGLNWLISLYERGLSGILADEMGLGKTVQCISLLGYLKNYRGINGPHLIIAPKSTLPNWMNELKRWCPSLNAICFIGSKEERPEFVRKKLLVKRWNVCVTSYEIARIEKSNLAKINYHYVVVDEAQKIKNENSLLSTCVRKFKSSARLLLTGTPLQNNLHELWALLNFLLPDVFSSSEDFDSWFNESSCLENQSLVDRLHAVLRPFLLRRIKADVEKSLPPKKEIRIYTQLTPMQKEWYRKILMNDIFVINDNSGKPKKRALFNVIMHLRKVCNHPYLFEGAEPKPFTTDYHLVENSGKMLVLDKLLSKLKSENSKVLLFSQMTKVLDILEDYCIWRNYEYCRLDGSTEYDVRQEDIDNFNDPKSTKFIYLLSTRAGGLGINLASANVVILYDSDWNPQMDLQAMDRAHRIGQTREVVVFRFVMQDTAEEKIVERAAAKLHLDRMVIQQGRLVGADATGPSAVEMLSVVRFGAEKILSSGSDTGISEADIDTILAQSKARSEEFDRKVMSMDEDNLKNLTIEQVEFAWTKPTQANTTTQEDASSYLFKFEGKDYRELRKRKSKVDYAELVLQGRRRKGQGNTSLVYLDGVDDSLEKSESDFDVTYSASPAPSK